MPEWAREPVGSAGTTLVGSAATALPLPSAAAPIEAARSEFIRSQRELPSTCQPSPCAPVAPPSQKLLQPSTCQPPAPPTPPAAPPATATPHSATSATSAGSGLLVPTGMQMPEASMYGRPSPHMPAAPSAQLPQGSAPPPGGWAPGYVTPVFGAPSGLGGQYISGPSGHMYAGAAYAAPPAAGGAHSTATPQLSGQLAPAELRPAQPQNEHTARFSYAGADMILSSGAVPPFAVYDTAEHVKLVVSTFNLACNLDNDALSLTLRFAPDETVRRYRRDHPQISPRR